MMNKTLKDILNNINNTKDEQLNLTDSRQRST